MELHADLEPVRFLIGSWQGPGRGEYPTIEPFAYREEASFVPGPGKPFLSYAQRTWADDGTPLHSEAGFVRMTPAGPELVIAQPTGLVEVHGGELVDRTIEFRSTMIGATETAKPVRDVVRWLVAVEDALSYTLDMAYAEVPLTLHLAATLLRV